MSDASFLHRRCILRAVVIITSLAALSGCSSLEVECLLPGIGLNVLPQQITVAPGDSGIVTASFPTLSWSGCRGPARTLRNAVTWSSSDPAIATILPLDSLRARVTGVARGQTTVIATSVDESSIKGAAAVAVP